MTTLPTDERRSYRLKVMLAATLKHDASQVRVRIVDLSRHGALITGEFLPAIESCVTLQCGSKAVSGHVTWKIGNQAGINFSHEVNHQGFASKAGTSGDFVVKDTRKVDFRRPGFRGNQLTPEECAFMAQLMKDHQIQMAA